MKAAVHTSYGPPDVVRIAEVGKPAAKDNQVLVKVHATTVNRTDCGMRAARPFFIRLFAGLVRQFQELLASGAFRPLVDRDLPAGRDRRGLPVRRGGSEARQRGDQRPASGPVTVMTTLPRPWPSTRCRMASGTSASG
jgi:hypothetical protein